MQRESLLLTATACILSLPRCPLKTQEWFRQSGEGTHRYREIVATCCSILQFAYGLNTVSIAIVCNELCCLVLYKYMHRHSFEQVDS